MFKKKKYTREKLKRINALIGDIYAEVGCISTTQPLSSFVFTLPNLSTKEKIESNLEHFITQLTLVRSLAASKRAAIKADADYLHTKTIELEDQLDFFEEFEVLYLEEKADSGHRLTHTFYKCRACKARVEKTERLLHAEQVHYTNVFYTIKTHKGVTTK